MSVKVLARVHGLQSFVRWTDLAPIPLFWSSVVHLVNIKACHSPYKRNGAALDSRVRAIFATNVSERLLNEWITLENFPNLRKVIVVPDEQSSFKHEFGQCLTFGKFIVKRQLGTFQAAKYNERELQELRADNFDTINVY